MGRLSTSKYDAYLKGSAQLTSQDLNGLALFNNPAKGNGTACHVSTPTATTPALFTDFSYDNVSIPRNWKIAANIALTAPYFHNGVFDTLEEAVTWYITRDTGPHALVRQG